MVVYADTSAAFKLVVEEAESGALAEWRRTAAPLVSSDLLVTELLRATGRVSSEAVEIARQVLETIELLPIGRERFEDAGTTSPPSLRSLDALHLVAAIGLGNECSGVLTYDERLADAARDHGVAVIAPA